MSDDRYAPEGQVWICAACAKISPYDRYGDEQSDKWWDVSCCLNAVLKTKEEAEALKKKYNEQQEPVDPGPGCEGV